MAEIQRGIAAIERWPAPSRRFEQTATQCVLQQVETHERLDIRPIAIAGTHLAPMQLDLASPIDHHLVIAPMRPAMERKANPARGAFCRRQ